MKNPVSFTSKNAPFKWGNFNHTLLVRAELSREGRGDKKPVRTIEGIVRSAKDLSVLAGISVSLKGTNIKAQTDSNGWFSILIEKPSADILVFTSAGFHATQLAINTEDFIHVNLTVAEAENSSAWQRFLSFLML